jgi:redox-regulated HSP33 family molecular chaperone
MTQEKLTVKDGKFLRGNTVVPLEHGNKEQIQLLKRVQEMQDGFDPEITIKKIIHMEFRCVCGALNDFDSFTQIDEDDPDTMIEGETDKCHYCGLLYKVTTFKTQYNDYLQLKLIPNKKASY